MAQNEKGGSDLDVFEGLGKKEPSNRTASGPASVPAPPGQGQRTAAAIDPKRTLVGLTIPSGAAGAAMPPPGRTPPPPPGRGSLPLVVSPRGPASPSNPATKAVSTAAVDMNWDEEDEATQIFDERDETHKVPSTAPAAPAGAPMHQLKATLLGLPVPSALAIPAPPAAGQAYPAPPSSPRGFGASPGGPSGLPHGGGMPPPPATQPGLGLGLGYPLRSSMPPPPSGSAPQAASTPFPRPSSDLLITPARGMEQTALVRPAPRRTTLWVGVGLAAAALVFVAFAFLGAPHTGRIVISVSDSKGADVNRVEIFVDGRKQCDTAPCVVDPVIAGSHEVKVLADGFDAPLSQTIAVEGHKDAPAVFTLGAAKGGTGVRVAGTQPGVKLYVDGKEAGPLPQDLHDLTPGEHGFRIAGSDRYQPIEKRLTVEKDEIADLGSVTLKVLKGKATISTSTPGARVYLVSGADRRELPMLPISVDIDTAKTWSLEANKPGFEDFKQPIGFDDGQAEKSYTVSLEPRSAAATVNAPNTAPGPAPAAPAPAPVAVAPAAAPAAAPQAAPAADVGEGFLNINSIPPSTCFLDGKSLGSTPRVHVSVRPGAHTVKFVNADEGLTKTVSVTVGPGETKPAVAKLN